MVNPNIKTFLIFLLASLFLRASTFFASVIDQDESIYFLIAQSWLQGNPPYIEIWDNKPPGIFFLFSLAIIIFGNSLISMRILACVATALTSYFLYKIGCTFNKNGQKIGWLTGFLYTIFSLHNGGDACNAEILFAPFVTLAFLLFFQSQRLSKIKTFLMGLILGMAMQIKYVVVMDISALLCLASLSIYNYATPAMLAATGEKNLKAVFKNLLNFYVIFGIGLSLPLMAIILYYHNHGYFHDYIYATLIANQKYVALVNFSLESFWDRFTQQISENFLIWLCLFISPFYWLGVDQSKPKEKPLLIYLGIWFAFAFIAVLLSKRFYDHYFLQLLPPLCLISGYLLIHVMYFPPIRNLRHRQIGLFLILIYPFFQSVYNRTQKTAEFVFYQIIQKIDDWDDREAAITKYLQPRVHQDDYIYIVNYQPILYYLIPAKIPTKYAFPSHLTSLSPILEVDAVQELNSIMQKAPVYVIVAKKNNINESYLQALNGYLDQKYFLEKTIQNIKLYKRID